MGDQTPCCLSDSALSGNSCTTALIPAGERTTWMMSNRGENSKELKQGNQFKSNNPELRVLTYSSPSSISKVTIQITVADDTKPCYTRTGINEKRAGRALGGRPPVRYVKLFPVSAHKYDFPQQGIRRLISVLTGCPLMPSGL